MQRIITIILLLGQVLIGAVRGQVICIPVGPCEQHAAIPDASECDHHGCAHETEPCGDSSSGHGDRVPEPAQHPVCALQSLCECHLHVPLPTAPHNPATAETAGGSQEFKPVPVVSVIAEFACDTGRAQVIWPPRALSDMANCGHRLAIKATRLRI